MHELMKMIHNSVLLCLCWCSEMAELKLVLRIKNSKTPTEKEGEIMRPHKEHHNHPLTGVFYT